MNLNGAVVIRECACPVWTQQFVHADSFFPPHFSFDFLMTKRQSDRRHLPSGWWRPIFSWHRWLRVCTQYLETTTLNVLSRYWYRRSQRRGAAECASFQPPFILIVWCVCVHVAVCERVLPVRHHCCRVSLFREVSWRTEARMLHIQHTELQLLLFNITVPQISV